MNSNFIRPPISWVQDINGDKIYNNPVNINLCVSISKERYKWLPSNEDKPTIQFKGCDEEWTFDDNKLRNKTFDKISNNDYIIINKNIKCPKYDIVNDPELA